MISIIIKPNKESNDFFLYAKRHKLFCITTNIAYLKHFFHGPYAVF